jgi:hypothetical protein
VRGAPSGAERHGAALPGGHGRGAGRLEGHRGGRQAGGVSLNGKVFTGRFGTHHVEVMFDRMCRENGISHKLTKPRSPTTTGKIERFHQSVRKELLADRTFALFEAAQDALDGWVRDYNTERPHQASRWRPRRNASGWCRRPKTPRRCRFTARRTRRASGSCDGFSVGNADRHDPLEPTVDDTTIQV